VDAHARLSSVWGCFVECGALNLSIGVRVVIWLRIFCFPWTSKENKIFEAILQTYN